MATDDGVKAGEEPAALDAEALRMVGAAVRQAREHAGIVQSGLAELTGIDRGYLSQIERGKRNPSLLVLLRLARLTGTTPGILMKGIK